MKLPALLLCAIATTMTIPVLGKTTQPAVRDGYEVVELRRYTIKPGQREHFAQYFDAYFPEAFQQLGALALGQFFERDKKDQILWLRAFHDMDERARANALFYYGPVWHEHRATLNALIDDSDNVLLLRPLDPERPLAVWPAVDPVAEPEGARGIGTAVIYPVRPGRVDDFSREARAMFDGFRTAAGVREAGLLCTLDARNNFTQLPIRTDGPFVVWLGVMPDERVLADTFVPLEERGRQQLEQSQLLSGAVERVILTPTKRSRLRWVTAP